MRYPVRLSLERFGRIADDNPMGTGILGSTTRFLLHHMGQLVGQQPNASIGLRRKLARTENNVAADCISRRVHHVR